MDITAKLRKNWLPIVAILIIFGVAYYFLSPMLAIYIPSAAARVGATMSLATATPISIEIGTDYDDNVKIANSADVRRLCQNSQYSYLTGNVKIFVYKSNANGDKIGSSLFNQDVGTTRWYCMNINAVNDPAARTSLGYTRIGTFSYSFPDANTYYYLEPVINFPASPITIKGALVKTAQITNECTSTSQAKCTTGAQIAYCANGVYANYQTCPNGCVGTVGSASCTRECQPNQIRCELGGVAFKVCKADGFYGELQYERNIGNLKCENNAHVSVCNSGEVKTVTCPSGSDITTQRCQAGMLGNEWTNTGATCPSIPPIPPVPDDGEDGDEGGEEECPTGSFLNTTSGLCDAIPTDPDCSPLIYDRVTDTCVAPPSPDFCTTHSDDPKCQDAAICKTYPNIPGCKEEQGISTTHLIIGGIVVIGLVGGIYLATRKGKRGG